jgi:hypothetical protein
MQVHNVRNCTKKHNMERSIAMKVIVITCLCLLANVRLALTHVYLKCQSKAIKTDCRLFKYRAFVFNYIHFNYDRLVKL